MNSVNIIYELQRLIHRREVDKRVDGDIPMVAREALEILKTDQIIGYFSLHTERLYPLLDRFATKKKKKGNKVDQKDFQLASYYLKDFASDLEEKYLNLLFNELNNAICEIHDHEAIFNLTNSLLSLMVDLGHSTTVLFSAVKNILCKQSREDFQSRFNNLRYLLTQGVSEFELTFKLRNFSKFHYSMNQVGPIRFLNNVDISITDESIQKFLSKKGLNVVFAQMKAEGLDAEAAGINGKQQLDNMLDLIRFELEGNIIDVDDQFLAIRADNSFQKLLKLPSQIPNPRRNINNSEFRDFLEDVEYVTLQAPISEESRKKITSAFRFYRLGRDAVQYENKFINWWTALEYLVRTGDEGSIISEVEEKITNILLLNYATKHLKSYIPACVFCGMDFGQSGIDPVDFYNSIQQPEEFKKIIDNLHESPLLKYALIKFQKHTQDPSAIHNFLKRHENHLRWHMNRLWRMRCDIVHSANYTINITLLSANLEYYLKTVLWMILKFLRANPCIESIEELFMRTDSAVKRLKEDLKEDDKSLFYETLKDTNI
ncbi:MAG: hypothetical protein ACQES9_14115 [Myxococcota bacterium]